MGFIRHIPGIRREAPPEPAAVQKGIGILGLHEGRTLLLGLDRCRRARPAGGCDLSEEKIEACRRERPDLFYTKDYAALLARPDVDIVAIYTPDHLHGEHVALAFEAGKDVICTKPLVNSAEDARRILEAGRRAGRRLLVGQSTRFFEPFRRQRRAYEAGEVGDLELVDAHYIHRMDWFYEKSPWAAKETDWVFLGLSHPVDLLRWYLGPIREVSALGRRSALGTEYGLEGLDVYIVNAAAASGRIGRAMGNYGVHELPTARNCIELVLYGSKGTSLARYHDMQYVHTSPDGTEVVEDPLYALRHHYFNSEVHGMHYGEFANYADHFAGALIDGTPASPELEEGIETFCVMEAVRRSARSGRPVEVGPILAEVGLEGRKP
jgi:predicted dehydrogenase